MASTCATFVSCRRWKPKEEEGLVPPVVELGDIDRAADIEVWLHEEDVLVQLCAGLLVIEQPVLHPARAPVERAHAMQFIGAALLHHADHAPGRVAILGGRQRGQHLDLRHRILNRLDCVRAALLIVATDTVFEDSDRAGALSRQVITAERTTIRIAARRHARHQVHRGIDVALIQRHVIQHVAAHHRTGGGRLGLE